MAAGCDFDRFSDFIGHDGSSQYYSLPDVYRFLSEHHITLGASADFSGFSYNKEQPRAPITIEDRLIMPLFRLAGRKKINIITMINEALSDFLNLNNEPLEQAQNLMEEVVTDFKGTDISSYNNLVVKIPLNRPAIVITNGFYDGDRVTSHAVFWDGQQILDPEPTAPDKPSAGDYVIQKWIPLHFEK